jgi:hypothetical protein|tara:strand:- start:435 stop:653 length:219 start_codon:yes stop_codon:yes gene_type:complete
MNKKTKAKLIGFKILLNKTGRLEVELSGLALKDVDKAFKAHPNKHVFRALISLANQRLDLLVEDLENHLSVL